MNLLVNIFFLTLAWTSAQSGSKVDKLYVLQKSEGEGSETLVVVTWKEKQHEISAQCDIYTDKAQIKEVLSADDVPIRTVSDGEMQTVLRECAEFSPGSRQESDYETNEIETEEPIIANAASKASTETSATTPGYDGIPVIFPGTKWCGAGDRAKNYDDLGLHQDTDRCCRAHDLCNDTLAPGETRNNLTNNSPFTKLSCKCDQDFYKCLDRVNSVTSNTIGNMYFNVLKRECYKEEYPVTKKCKKYRTFLKLKCKEYERDTNAPKVNQWEPAKKYKKLPFPGPLTITLPF